MRFRPGDLPKADPTEMDTPVEWEDNWLSNSLAWFSHRILPTWCQSEDHWTARTVQYLFTDCPCCLLFRGLSLGFAGGLLTAALLLVLARTALALFAAAS